MTSFGRMQENLYGSGQVLHVVIQVKLSTVYIYSSLKLYLTSTVFQVYRVNQKFLF